MPTTGLTIPLKTLLRRTQAATEKALMFSKSSIQSNGIYRQQQNDWGINNATKLILEGIAARKEDISDQAKQLGDFKTNRIRRSDFESLGLEADGDVVIATSDQPAFKLLPRYLNKADVPKQQEERFIQQTNEEFKEQIHQVEAVLGEENDWNAF